MKLGFVVGGVVIATAAILNVLPEYIYIVLTGKLPSRTGTAGTAAPPAGSTGDSGGGGGGWSGILPGGKAIEQALQGPLQSQNQQPGGGGGGWSAPPGAGFLDAVQKHIERALQGPLQSQNQQQPQVVETPSTIEKPDWLRPVTGAE
jgi:hypothetical protein